MAAKENHAWVIEEKELNEMEALETVTLDRDETDKTTRIGTTLSPEMRASLIQFLQQSLDVFVWSHEDMPGIPTEIIQHKLNVNPVIKPVHQRRKVFAHE